MMLSAMKRHSGKSFVKISLAFPSHLSPIDGFVKCVRKMAFPVRCSGVSASKFCKPKTIGMFPWEEFVCGFLIPPSYLIGR